MIVPTVFRCSYKSTGEVKQFVWYINRLTVKLKESFTHVNLNHTPKSSVI